MPHQSVRKHLAPRVKVTRLATKIPCRRPRSAAQQAPLDYRRPLKTGNIVQTSTPVFDGLWAPDVLLDMSTTLRAVPTDRLKAVGKIARRTCLTAPIPQAILPTLQR